MLFFLLLSLLLFFCVRGNQFVKSWCTIYETYFSKTKIKMQLVNSDNGNYHKYILTTQAIGVIVLALWRPRWTLADDGAMRLKVDIIHLTRGGELVFTGIAHLISGVAMDAKYCLHQLLRPYTAGMYEKTADII